MWHFIEREKNSLTNSFEKLVIVQKLFVNRNKCIYLLLVGFIEVGKVVSLQKDTSPSPLGSELYHCTLAVHSNTALTNYEIDMIALVSVSALCPKRVVLIIFRSI